MHKQDLLFLPVAKYMVFLVVERLYKLLLGGKWKGPVFLKRFWHQTTTTLFYTPCDMLIKLKNLQMLFEACLLFIKPVWSG